MSINNKFYVDSCTPYNSIDVIDAWDLNFCLGNVVEFVSRAAKETGSEKLSDLNTALFLTSEENAKKTQSKEKSQ